MRKVAFVFLPGLFFACALLVWRAMPGVAQDGTAIHQASDGRQPAVALAATQVVTLTFQQGVWPSPSYSGTEDTYIYRDKPVDQYGSRDDLWVNWDGAQKILLRFDVSTIPTQAIVASAQLELYAYGKDPTNNAVTDVGLYQILRPWVENEATWRDAASGAPWQQEGCDGSGDRASDPSAVTTFRSLGWQVWQNGTLQQLVQAWVSSPAANYGMALSAYGTNVRQFWHVYSSEYGVTAAGRENRPKLTVSYYIAEPTATPTRSRTPTPTLTPTAILTQALVSGLAWQDANRNRVRDGGELPMPGVTVVLRDAGYVEVDRTTTAGDGSYEFALLEAGNYVLTKVDPPGYDCTHPRGGAYAFYLAPGQRLTGLDFGFASPATVTPTATQSPTPTLTPTRTATPTITPTGLPTLTPTRTASPTVTPPGLPTSTPTRTSTPTSTATATPTSTATPRPTPTATPSGTFQDPIPVVCQRTYSGDTAGHSAVIRDYGACLSGLLGPEVIYVLPVTSALDYLSVAMDTTADLILLVLRGADPSGCLGWGGSVGLPDIDPGTYYIVVDGFAGGAYRLEIRCEPLPQDTPTPTATVTTSVTPGPSPTPTVTTSVTPGPSPTPTNTRTPGGPSMVYLPVVMRRYPIEFLVDCGSESPHVDSMGRHWLADEPYSAGNWGYVGASMVWISEADVANTADPYLYQRLRYAFGSFGYQFDVPNGMYEVELHFAEPWWAAPGRRVFDVNIEGQVKLDNYDVYVAAGGRLRARVETFEVTVDDGQLNVDFVRGAVDFPLINALRVRRM